MRPRRAIRLWWAAWWLRWCCSERLQVGCRPDGRRALIRRFCCAKSRANVQSTRNGLGWSTTSSREVGYVIHGSPRLCRHDSVRLVGYSVENHLLQSWIREFLCWSSVCRSDLDVVAKFTKLFREVFGTIDEELWFGFDALALRPDSFEV